MPDRSVVGPLECCVMRHGAVVERSRAADRPRDTPRDFCESQSRPHHGYDAFVSESPQDVGQTRPRCSVFAEPGMGTKCLTSVDEESPASSVDIHHGLQSSEDQPIGSNQRSWVACEPIRRMTKGSPSQPELLTVVNSEWMRVRRPDRSAVGSRPNLGSHRLSRYRTLLAG